MGVALDSIVCAGCVISGGRVVRSVLEMLGVYEMLAAEGG